MKLSVSIFVAILLASQADAQSGAVPPTAAPNVAVPTPAPTAPADPTALSQCDAKIMGLLDCLTSVVHDLSNARGVVAFCEGPCPQNITDVYSECPGGEDIVDILEVCSACALGAVELLECGDVFPENVSELHTFCAGGCIEKFRDHVTACPDDENVANVDSLVAVCSACALGAVELLECGDVILEIDFSNLSELRTFCAGECIEKFRDHFTACPDDENVGHFDSLAAACSACTLGTVELLECGDVIEEIDFSNLSDMRTFCAGGCIEKFRDHFTACPDDENVGNFDSLAAGCAAFGNGDLTDILFAMSNDTDTGSGATDDDTSTTDMDSAVRGYSILPVAAVLVVAAIATLF